MVWAMLHQNKITELKTVIKLRGPIRSPELEKEIFSNEILYTLYLDELCKEQCWYCEGVDAAGLAYLYAVDIIQGRFIEAESIIATDPKTAFDYAVYVIKGRQPAAEPVIANDPRHAYYYANHVIKGRWLEAEAVIATDRHWAQRYNEWFGTNI
jgi:hypothetical protein